MGMSQYDPGSLDIFLFLLPISWERSVCRGYCLPRSATCYNRLRRDQILMNIESTQTPAG